MLDLATIADPPVAEHQYRYVDTHAWWLASIGSGAQRCAFLGENFVRQWVPADPGREWLLDRRSTSRRIWLSGATQDSAESKVVDAWPTGRWRARYGDYRARPGLTPLPRHGTWQQPSARFLADLPRDPPVLYERLVADPLGQLSGLATAVVRARSVLRTGLVPSDLRSALYQALLLLPATRVDDAIENADGQPGTALTIDDGFRRIDIIFEPGTGQFIGEREMLITGDADLGLRAGAITESTAVAVYVVDKIGDLPA